MNLVSCFLLTQHDSTLATSNLLWFCCKQCVGKERICEPWKHDYSILDEWRTGQLQTNSIYKQVQTLIQQRAVLQDQVIVLNCSAGYGRSDCGHLCKQNLCIFNHSPRRAQRRVWQQPLIANFFDSAVSWSKKLTTENHSNSPWTGRWVGYLPSNFNYWMIVKIASGLDCLQFVVLKCIRSAPGCTTTTRMIMDIEMGVLCLLSARNVWPIRGVFCGFSCETNRACKCIVRSKQFHRSICHWVDNQRNWDDAACVLNKSSRCVEKLNHDQNSLHNKVIHGTSTSSCKRFAQLSFTACS